MLTTLLYETQTDNFTLKFCFNGVAVSGSNGMQCAFLVFLFLSFLLCTYERLFLVTAWNAHIRSERNDTKLFVCIEYEYEYVAYPVHCEHNLKPIPYNLPRKIYFTCQTHTLNSPAATITTITALYPNDSKQVEINNSLFDWIIAQKSSTLFNLEIEYKLFMCIYLYVLGYTEMGITVFSCIAWHLICIHHLDLYHPYFVIMMNAFVKKLFVMEFLSACTCFFSQMNGF